MKQFKKRTLALVLASVVTVVGAFGAENYKNSLMSLNFYAGSGGSVNAMLLTKEHYNGSVSPTRMDANTYVIMLPDTNSEVPDNIELGSVVKSVDIKTMPYTKTGNGYTKITIKTKQNALLTVRSGIYMPTTAREPEKIETTAESETDINEQTVQDESTVNDDKQKPAFSAEEEKADRELMSRTAQKQQESTIRSSNGVAQTGSVDINKTIQQFQGPSQVSSTKKDVKKTKKKSISISDLDKEEKTSKHQEILYMILGVAFVIATSVFLMLKAKEKLIEITGERANYDVSDDTKPGRKKKEKPKLNTTIKNLDKRYTRPVKMPIQQEEKLVPGPEADGSENVQEVENVVDLDELLNEQKAPKPEAPVNEALEDFLSSFNLEDEAQEEETEKQEINEELYDKYINDKNMEFSKDDVEKIETLMSSEISDDAMRNASEFMESSEKNKRPSPLQILESLVTTYIMQQNITFTKDDIDALYKLINVEIDNDFITDLRTNPSRMQEMQDEIARQKAKPHKTSELLTLNVKDMLPDLSEALKKQGGRRIESEVKPQVVYASEGYDVSTLKLNMDLPDLSKEINNKDAYKARPSDDIQYVDTNYEVQKMSISNDLPDLEDMLKHPEKYETPEPEEVEVDEEALLKNITNVTFKPFDDGTREFEILNDFGPAPTVSDMQAEFDKFGDNFEIVSDDDYVPEVKEAEQNDFETLYDGKYVDFDKDINSGADAPAEEQPAVQEISAPQVTELQGEAEEPELIAVNGEADELKEFDSAGEIYIKPVSSESNDLQEYPEEEKKEETTADKLLSQIKAFENRRKAKSAARKQTQSAGKNLVKENKPIPEFCILDGKRFSIISVSYFTEQMGCYLAKNDEGYCIIGFAGDSVFKIKYYEKLGTEKLQSRVSEKLEDGTTRYIVRIGIHKFILNVKGNDMEFVMDLC